ncbi:hypothetical protein, partial [Mucilaginibacter humi]|uniref:hypothetical protein n=1 Tax=Mucilaginibacter humi TaxID=2732510 RepID=UPI001C2E7C4F
LYTITSMGMGFCLAMLSNVCTNLFHALVKQLKQVKQNFGLNRCLLKGYKNTAKQNETKIDT